MSTDAPGTRGGATSPPAQRLDPRRVARLLEVGRSLVSELDLDVVLERVLAVARELTGARYAALGVLDERRVELERFLTSGIDAETRAVIGDLPRGHGILGVLIRDPRPLRLDDIGSHPRSYGFPLGHPEMHGFLGVPVLIRGQAYGNLYLTEKEGGAFDDADEEALVVLAQWAGIAIDNARLYRDVRERRDELERAVSALETTSSIARALGGETDLDRILELLVKRGRALVDARVMIIELKTGGELVVRAAAGEAPDDLVGTQVPVAGSVAGEVLRSRRTLRVTDARAQLRFRIGERLGASTGLLVPLAFRGEVLGVMGAFDRTVGGPEFTAEDERLIQAFASAAATAVATAQHVAAHALQRSVEASEQERRRWARELHDDTLQELAALRLLLSGARRTGDPARLQEAVDDAVDRTQVAIDGLRRLINDLRPAVLDELGIEPAVEALADRVREASDLQVVTRTDLDFEAGRAPARLEDAVEIVVYRLVQESLTNVVKHAGASTADVAVQESDGAVQIMVRDDGRGFDAEGCTEGFGLLGMQERVTALGGRVDVASVPGEGTTIRAVLPARHRPAPEPRADLATG